MIKSNGGIIGPDNVTTGGPFGSASGVFKLGEVTDLIKDSKWPTAGPASYQVANSLRFNDGSSDSLTRSLGASETSTQKGTFSYWIKRSTLSTNQVTISNEVADDNNRGYIQFNTSDNFRMVDEKGIVLATNAVYRDTSAWYHFVIALDSTLGTTTDRFKLYVNGVRETSFQSSGYFNNGFPNQNINFDILTGGQTNKNHIGKIHSSGSDLDAYLAEFVYIDGSQLDATSFGEFDSDSGIWKPKDVSGLTFGNNGFYLDFKDSSALGNDAAGSNNFTATNLTSIDQSIDTCTNNFATLNPLTYNGDSTTQAADLSEGNLKLVSSSAYKIAPSTIAVSSGKWYVEHKITGGTPDAMVGVIDTQDYETDSNIAYVGQNTNSVGYYKDGRKFIGNSATSYGATYTTNDIIGIALDLDSGTKTITFYKNNATQGAINLPTAGSEEFYFLPSPYNATIETNFGSPSFSITSGNADGNGFGNFEYAPPSGHLALCTNNLNS